IYFPETYRSIRENPRFRTHFLTLNPSLLPGLIAGIVLGLALWLGSGSLWLLLGGVVLGLMGASLLKLAADPSRSRKNRDDNFRD
ncbi:hypothetical protein, partial [Corynebacterium marquesiae]